MSERKSGTDGTTASGTTGAHPRPDTLLKAGPGTRATGTTEDTSSDFRRELGIDSKAINGSNTDHVFQLRQASQGSQESADHSTCSKSMDSQDPSVPEDSRDAASAASTTSGRTMPLADSSEENSFT